MAAKRAGSSTDASISSPSEASPIAVSSPQPPAGSRFAAESSPKRVRALYQSGQPGQAGVDVASVDLGAVADKAFLGEGPHRTQLHQPFEAFGDERAAIVSGEAVPPPGAGPAAVVLGVEL